MKFERRNNANGTHYYRFSFYDQKLKKVIHMSKEEVRKRFGKDILTEEEAQQCLKLLSAKHESEKVRIQRRLKWQTEYYEFSKLADDYLKKQKKRAPNSWENNVFYLKHYVLYYFLQKAEINLIDLWPDHFEKFRAWLETAKRVRGNAVIAYASKNHAIKALNTFLDHLEKERIVNFSQRCETFPEHLLNSRTIDDVVRPDEMEQIYQELKDQGHKKEAILYRYLYFSGMRFNEALAVSVGDLFQGEIASTFLKKKLNAYEIKYHGYIVADGQFGSIDDHGKVLRVPFKGRKKIEEKYNRTLPIIDKKLWNDIVELAEEAHTNMKGNQTSRDCLLFSNLNDATATTHLRLAYNSRKLHWRPWHCLRHSRATYLIGETSDTMLARIWLGQSSTRTIEKYNHLFQAITRQAKAKVTTGKKLNLKKVD